MIRAGTVLFLFLLLAPLAAVTADAATPAAPAAQQASVFIDTEPMGARVLLDNEMIPESTPLLARGLKPGKHTVTLAKDGFTQVTQTVIVADGTVPVVQVDLAPDSVQLSFPSNSKLTAPGGDFDTEAQQFRFATGNYHLTEDAGRAVLTPDFPDQGLLDLAGWSLALVTLSAVASTASDVWHIRTGWTDHPSTLSVGLWFSTLMEIPWYLSVQGRKDRFDKANVPQVTPLSLPLTTPDTLFKQGDTALKGGDLVGAEALFGRFVNDFPTSRLVPGAWFRLARIHSVTGRREQATGEYRLISETLPQAEYYDRARRALSDLYLAAGDKVQALTQLNLMVLTDGFFSKDDIEAQKTALRTEEAPPAN